MYLKSLDFILENLARRFSPFFYLTTVLEIELEIELLIEIYCLDRTEKEDIILLSFLKEDIAFVSNFKFFFLLSYEFSNWKEIDSWTFDIYELF